MIKELTNIANELDSKGLIKEADTLDLIIKEAQIQQQAKQLCFVSGFDFMGQIRIDVRCVDVETSEILEAKGFDPTNSENPIAEAKALIADWKQKYPQAKWGWEKLQPPIRFEDLGLTEKDKELSE